MDADQLTAKIKSIPPLGWAAIAGVSFLGYRWYMGRQVEPVALEDGSFPETGPVGYLTATGTGSTEPTQTGSGSGKTTFESNVEWEAAGVEYLVARGFTGGFAQTALGKALAGDAMSTAEKAAVSLVLGVLGTPPGGMPPLGSDPPPGPAPTTPPPAPAVWKGPVKRKAGGPVIMSIKSLGSGGRWTWAQLIPQFYENPPPAGPKLTAAASQLRLANAWRLPFKGTYKWDTYPANTAVSVPIALPVY